MEKTLKLKNSSLNWCKNPANFLAYKKETNK